MTEKEGAQGVSVHTWKINCPGISGTSLKANTMTTTFIFVQEVTVAEKTAYLVKIEDKTSMKTIRVLDGEMTEIEAFEKSK